MFALGGGLWVETQYLNTSLNQDISEASAAKRTQAEHMQARGSSPVLADASGQVHTPYCNTGYETPLTQETPRKRSSLLSFRFDWYQATLPQEVEPQEVLRWASCLGTPTPSKPMHGYDTVHDFGQIKVLYGGHSGQFGVHVVIHGGDSCQDIVQYFRKTYPEHRPSRIDVCLDFQGPGSWDDLYQIAKLAAGRFGVKTRLYGDFINAESGRTIYLGTGNSTHKVRVYEKGHEQRAKKANPEAPLDWVRSEIQVRPTGHSRASAASMTPDQVARSTKWTAFFCDALGSVSAPSVSLTTRKKQPPAVDSFEHMCAQYAGTLFKLNREAWISKEDVLALVSDMYDMGTFNGLPQHVIRNWYF